MPCDMLERETEQALFHELAAYTLTHPNPAFIHQNVVDAFAAQTADENTKPITITFALVGLYLCVECGQTGRDAQHVHVLLARRRRKWPHWQLPEERGHIRVGDVVAAPPGTERDDAIQRWCESVWQAYSCHRDAIARLLQTALE